VLVEPEVEMFELASESSQRECVGFEMVRESGLARCPKNNNSPLEIIRLGVLEA